MKELFLFAAVMFAANLSQAQWEPDVRLTNDSAGSYTSVNNQWCIVAGGDTVHIVWYDYRDANDEIYYKRSTDGGLSWGDDTRLTNNSATSTHPSISLSGSTVHVAWSDYRDGNNEIYYKRSTDRGSSWGTDTRLTNASGSSFNPSVAVTGLIVNIVWYDVRDGNWEIYDKRSTDGGSTWEPDTRLTNDPANSYNACVAASDSVVHVVWGDYRDGANGEIYYKRSSDGGVSWGQDIRMTNNPDSSRRPCVAASGSFAHVVWFDHRDGNNEIYYKRSADGGISWGADTRLTNSLGDSFNPSIAISGSTVHVVWSDNRDGDSEIYYKRSDDEGLNWGTDTRLTDALNSSEYPSIAISGAMVHIVWNDYRDGNPEIYYKRDPTGGFAVAINNELTGNSGQQISFYPNPASSVITLKFNDNAELPVANANEKTEITIRNLFGEELLSKQIQNGELMIDVSNLQNGLYFVRITTSKKYVESRKLIIIK